MRSPAELDRIRWHELTHAYGSAEDVPDLIRALYREDEEATNEAVYELYGNIHHQGTVYPASAPAVPFLVHAALHAPGKHDELLMLLAVLADHDPAHVDSPHWSGSPVAAVCAELCRLLPDLLPCLEDGDRAVRRAALRVVSAVAELLPAALRANVVARLDELYATDPVSAVRADAVIVLARLGQERAALESSLPDVRLAAAVLAAERSEPPYRAELVEIIAADGAEPDPGDDDFPWSGTTTQDERLTHLLTRDPDACLSVAARWIAAGDLGTRGSWLAEQIAATWRDHEPEVLDLLRAALPHHGDARTLTARLRTIGHWIECLPAPDPDLRETLHTYAETEDESAEAALLALVRSRDPRALDLVLHRPSARLLEAAARHHPQAADRLVPAIRRELAGGATGNDGIALVRALASFGTAARQAEPELVDCLRERRAAIVAARQLGLNDMPTQETVDLLRNAMQSTDLSLRAAAAAAHHRLTGDADPALHTFRELLTGSGQTHWYLSDLEPLGSSAAPLLPLVEPMLEAGQWTRMAAAEAHHWITGSPDRAVPVLAELVGPTPVGLRALKALAVTGRLPEELRPVLRGFMFSPLRLLADSPLSGQGHPDGELRSLARTLLAEGSPPTS